MATVHIWGKFQQSLINGSGSRALNKEIRSAILASRFPINSTKGTPSCAKCVVSSLYQSASMLGREYFKGIYIRDIWDRDMDNDCICDISKLWWHITFWFAVLTYPSCLYCVKTMHSRPNQNNKICSSKHIDKYSVWINLAINIFINAKISMHGIDLLIIYMSYHRRLWLSVSFILKIEYRLVFFGWYTYKNFPGN